MACTGLPLLMLLPRDGYQIKPPCKIVNYDVENDEMNKEKRLTGNPSTFACQEKSSARSAVILRYFHR